MRQRHASSGGFGPVQHVAVSQLTHFVLGGIINEVNTSDADTIEQLLFDMDCSSQTFGGVDHKGATFCVDRGYRIPSVEAKFDKAKCNIMGTQQRRKTHDEFPFTFDHPDAAHNVSSDGVPVSLHAKKGREVALAHRDFKGKVVLLKSTHSKWVVPLEGFLIPPLAPPMDVTSSVSDGLVSDPSLSESPSLSIAILSPDLTSVSLQPTTCVPNGNMSNIVPPTTELSPKETYPSKD